MGGCSPSKMPDDAPQVERKISKFSFGSSFRRNSHSANSSLNASQSRIKNLADVDDTYEIVKGGRTENEVEKTNGHAKTSGSDELDELTRETGSQTSVPLHRDISGSYPLDSKLVRPSLLGTASKSVFHGAPLATSETASELGTPTPMEENKSFAKSNLPSYLPQPGQQRPLHFPAHSPSRLPFPRLPSSSSSVSTPQPTPLAVASINQPAVQSLTSPRPKDPPPKPPNGKRALIPPGTLTTTGGGRNGTDNVMVTTNVSPRLPAQSLSAGGIPKPGTLNAGSKSGTSNLTERSQSKASVDSVKSNGSAGGKKTSDSGIAGHHDMEERTPYKHGDHNMPSLNLVPVSPRTTPKSGLRMPVTMGAPPRGPLALQPHKQFSASLPLQPAKPARKSPLPAATPEISQHQRSREDMTSRRTPTDKSDLKQFAEPIDARSYSGLAHRETFISHGFMAAAEGDGDSIMEDSDLYAEREAMAERPKEYRLDEFSLEDILSTICDAKKIAQNLLDMNDSTAWVMNGRHGDSKVYSEKFTRSESELADADIGVLLAPPTMELLNDPVRSHELIISLQEALRVSILRHKNS